MSDELGHTDDISQLWGADGVWEPAPPRRAEPVAGAHHNGKGQGDAEADRLDTLERDVRALLELVARVDDRLDRLERQVADVTDKAAGERRGNKAMTRLSGVIKSAKSH